MVSMRSEKPICAPSGMSDVSPNVASEAVPMFVWLTMALSRPFKEDRLLLPLSRFLCNCGLKTPYRPTNRPIGVVGSAESKWLGERNFAQSLTERCYGTLLCACSSVVGSESKWLGEWNFAQSLIELYSVHGSLHFVLTLPHASLGLQSFQSAPRTLHH